MGTAHWALSSAPVCLESFHYRRRRCAARHRHKFVAMKYQAIARQLFLILLFFVLCANSPLAAQGAREGDALHQALRRELIRMGNEDQKYRNELVALMKRLPEPDNQQVVKKFVAVGKKQSAIDKKLMKRLEEIIQK